MKLELSPRLRLAITTPSYACSRFLSPSTTETFTITVSPGANSGILRPSRLISSWCNVWIRSIFDFPFGFRPSGLSRRAPVGDARGLLLLLRRLLLAPVFLEQLPVVTRELRLVDQVGPAVPRAPQRLLP